jgi:DeoR/GlpR family transcriptional regulator of sugar metabolism
MNQRREQLISLLSSGATSIKELSSKLYVSEVTVRRALKPLIEEGLITYSRGKITLNGNEDGIAACVRIDTCIDEKIIMARRAAEHLCGGELIYIDSSDTCTYLLPELVKRKPRLVVTNSLDLCMGLGNLGIMTKLTGGDYNPFDRSVGGYGALRCICTFNFDIAFLSSSGMDMHYISDIDEDNLTIHRTVLEHSVKTLFLMSKETRGKRYPYIVAETDDVIIITGDD